MDTKFNIDKFAEDDKKAAEDFQCVVCYEVALNYLCCKECEAFICKQCKKATERRSKKCPKCSVFFEPLAISRLVRNLVKGLRIECYCEETVTIENYPKHCL